MIWLFILMSHFLGLHHAAYSNQVIRMIMIIEIIRVIRVIRAVIIISFI